MKKTIFEAIGIVIAAGIIGIIYNFLSDKPLAIFKEGKNYFVPDSVLFQGLGSNKDTVKTYIDTVSVLKDTSHKQDLAKSDTGKIKKDTSTEKPQEHKYFLVTYNQVLKLLGNPNVIFIDARIQQDYGKAHIGNAINIYPYEENENDYFSKINRLDRNKTYVVYCDGGLCDLSHTVIRDMLNFDFKKVYLFAGGWDEWLKEHKLKI
jgi:rhodanese-related sulfurtransferase